MKKLLIPLFISLTLFSCQDNQAVNDMQSENETITEQRVVEETEEETSLYEYEVPYTSSNFSPEDLIYFIMVDRFYDGDPSNNNFDDFSDDKTQLKYFLGGDLEGVIKKLDYIKEQGATAIWLTPVNDNEPFGYHGYWTEDFEAVDPHLGDMATLKKLVDEAHSRDIKVILDYVVNHTGYNHPWLEDPEKKDWFHGKGTITNFNDKDQLLNYNLAGLPDLNTENPQVKDYFYKNVLYWIDQTGVDGLRLDTVKHVPNEFWNEFAYIIKDKYPDFFLLGEVFASSPTLLSSYNEVGFDSVTNYSMYDGIKDTFKLYGDANKLKIALNNQEKFDDPTMSSIFLDNHDVKRLISQSSKNGDLFLKQGLTFVMTYPSIPIIYYGTEVGLDGKDDPENRKMMVFEENEIYDYYQSLIGLRNETRDLKDVEILDVSKDYIVIKYSNFERSMITAFNISAYEQTIQISGPYKNYFTGQDMTGELILEAMSSLVLMEE
ncbi:hypothetical protein EZV73_11890 [Acidaminobacter sp. JC074]|uniref:alpha-amylase family glycosyl hydrolase n=1 Tax=Acidaminobacter sp. JC074 TaxID=2530199 RepID=UPI001F0F54AF|nr:alpha-amylase family glycosyl hydrolase [Acidaminobacter sp. JC074]MCH4888281.1 hypothetical protein [Acidaminobacter sp. JC074]